MHTIPMRDDERTALLRTGQRNQKTRASAIWILLPCFVFSLLEGAVASVEMEVYNQTACRTVAARASVPSDPLRTRMETGGDWVEWCRSDIAVQRETTRIVTSVLLVAGTLSALTAAWWGALADRKGRKFVLFVSSAAELFEAVTMIFILGFPERFGHGALLLLAACAGLSGGQLANMAVASAYLGDIAGPGSKAQLLSSYEAALFAGLGFGPLLGSALVRRTSLGPRAPYLLMVLCRLAYLASFAFMPESLPPADRRCSSSSSGEQDHRSALQRCLAVPKNLVEPFKVLLPRQNRDGARKDGRLSLVAISGALLLIDTGLGPLEVLYTRAKFGWGPPETGNWLSFACACKLVVLLGLVPLVRRCLIPSSIQTSEADARKGAAAQWRFDLSIARWTLLASALGYLLMLPRSRSVIPFLLTTATASIAAAAPPVLQSVALSLADPHDKAKVLACLSALATVSTATLGPSVFGATYVATVERWPEGIFAVAALWMGAAAVPLLVLRGGASPADEEEQREDVQGQ